MDTDQMEIAVNITHTETSQQSILITNHLASKNTKKRSEEIYISYLATLISAATKGEDFKQERWRTSDRVVEKFGHISREHVSRMTSLLIHFGLFEKVDRHFYKITDRGKEVYQKGFKYQICRILELKRIGENYVFDYLADMSNSIKKAVNHSSDHVLLGCSYIEETKDELINISQSLFGSFVDHISLSPEERMLKNIKKRDFGIDEKDIDTLFAMVRRNVGYIKNKRWFDEFNRCFQTAANWLKQCRETWEDGETYFSTMWTKMGRSKTFISAEQLYELLDKLINNNREEWERDNITYSFTQ